MELNRILFPAPQYREKFQEDKLKKEFIMYIPKSSPSVSPRDFKLFNLCGCQKPKDIGEYIPCRYIEYNQGNNFSPKILMYFHGNAEDIIQPCLFKDAIASYLKINILVVEYPGYSIYKGKPSTQQIESDALIVYDYLVQYKKIQFDNIWVFGRSIGSGPACFLASQRPVGLLILMSGLRSIRNVAKNIVGSFLSRLVKERFINENIIQDVESPIFFIHGLKDEIISWTHSQELYRRSTSRKIGFMFPQEMTHNSFQLVEDVIEPILFFCNKVGIDLSIINQRVYDFQLECLKQTKPFQTLKKRSIQYQQIKLIE